MVGATASSSLAYAHSFGPVSSAQAPKNTDEFLVPRRLSRQRRFAAYRRAHGKRTCIGCVFCTS